MNVRRWRRRLRRWRRYPWQCRYLGHKRAVPVWRVLQVDKPYENWCKRPWCTWRVKLP